MQDLRGSWVILFSHPADFTPVCTSEFIAIQNNLEAFQALKCQVLGLSVDSIYSHIAWIKSIQQNFDVEIGFPIIEDISMTISRAYGMLDEHSNSTSTVRAVFFINPEGVLRAKILYPMQVGRSIQEILRTLAALQQAELHQATTPENWHPGDAMVPLAPTTIQEANARPVEHASPEWYYGTSTTVN